jgi:5-formyltetrahydrofolate cyclo-ligase
MSKASIRQKFIDKRHTMSPEDVSAHSDTFCQNLDSVPELESVKPIASYYPLGNEISPLCYIKAQLKKGRRVVFPRHNSKTESYEMVPVSDLDNDFISGRFGVMEPRANLDALSDLNDISAWLIPGIAFDHQGTRLGFGKGIYDRLLSQESRVKIGCAYSWQVVETLPRETHDVAMDCLVTE